MINENDLEEIINAVIWSYEECGFEVPQNILDTCNKLKQICKNQFTFDECIKKWKEKSYDVFEWNNPKRYEISNGDETIHFEIIQIKGQYLVDNHCCQYAEPEIIHLLSKTLKALEVENGK